jgi:transcriptional regulator with XRE-family HTH domain
MPERSFGRSVRYRRTKLGLSQAQLGELVGRSASSIRSWERDASTPTDTSVLLALSAILGLDQRSLFEKAGVDLLAEEARPTVEQALASLTPQPMDDPLTRPAVAAEFDFAGNVDTDPPSEPVELEPEPQLDADFALEAEVMDQLEIAADPEFEPSRELEPESETFSLRPDMFPEKVGASAMRTSPEPAFVSPPEPFTMTTPSPPFVEPSYMEDSEQRQLYRVRNLATVVLFVGLVIVLLWSLSNTLEAFGEWWNDFFGSLRL